MREPKELDKPKSGFGAGSFGKTKKKEEPMPMFRQKKIFLDSALVNKRIDK